MRSLSKVLVVAVCLVAIGMLSSAVYGNDVLAGSFTLSHATQWNNAMLPAGNYTFRLARTQWDTRLMTVHGAKKSLMFNVFPQSECAKCQRSELTVAVQGENRAVTSLDLIGYHVNFPIRSAALQEQLSKAPASSEQVAVQVSPN